VIGLIPWLQDLLISFQKKILKKKK